MPRLQADADPMLWVPVTDSLGFTGRRHRKAAIRMLLTQANRAMGRTDREGSGLLAWSMSQAAPFLMKRAAGRVPKLKGGETYRVHLAISALTSKSEVDAAASAIQALASSKPVISRTPTGP